MRVIDQTPRIDTALDTAARAALRARRGPEDMRAAWMKDELRDARSLLASAERFRQRALRAGKTPGGDYLNSIDALIAVRQKWVRILEEEMASYAG